MPAMVDQVPRGAIIQSGRGYDFGRVHGAPAAGDDQGLFAVRGCCCAKLGEPSCSNLYMVTSITMPFECETHASPKEPLLGLYIDVDMVQLHDLIGRMGFQAEIGNGNEKYLPHAIGPAVMDDAMTGVTNRLIKCLQSETESHILGPGLVREILYRGRQGGL